VKTIREALANFLPDCRARATRWLKPALTAALGLAACAAIAAPSNDNFANAWVLAGLTGTTNGDNTGATIENCETNMVYTDDYGWEQVTNSVWFAWTAPTNGVLEVDTDGGVPTNDYVLSIWTSTNSAPTMCDHSLTNILSDDEIQVDPVTLAPYSQDIIPVVAGTTYYFEVSSYDDGTPGDNVGAYQLNWNVSVPTTNSFATPQAISGDWGSVTVTNVGIAPNPAGPTIAGLPSQNTVWFQWVAPSSGEVTLDTYGSVDTATGLDQLDTVLGVYTGSDLATLSQVAANDDLYPVQGSGVFASGQYEYPFSTNELGAMYFGTTNPPLFAAASALVGVTQPFGGPSGLHFNAVKGTTYYFAVDTKPNPGPGAVVLNWAYHPSGIFRFATENSDATGLTYSNTVPMLMYQVSETESVAPKQQGGFRVTHDISGALITITRVGGSSGRMTVNYATADIGTNSYLYTNGFLLNGDLPAAAGLDYVQQSGTLTFDDFEMSKTISVPIFNTQFLLNGKPITLARPNRDFLIFLSNPVADPAESSDVAPPRVDPTYSGALVRILDVYTDPRGISTFPVVFTNITATATNTLTNTFYTTSATNPVLNFQKSFFQTLRWGTNQTISVWVNRTGTNLAACSVDFIVNSGYPFDKNVYPNNDNNQFPLQGGSDYATPIPFEATHESKVPDFNFPGGYSGTLNWAANDFQPKAIQFNLYNNGLQQFNEDFQIDLYVLDSNGNPHPVGMVNQCNVTIGNAADVTAETYPPAGSVDEFYNADFGSDFYLSTDPPNMQHPGTDGEVYGIALLPNGEAVVVGNFETYDTYGMNNIALATPNGFIDHSFNPGQGPDSFVSSVVLTANNEILIGGDFSSYNGQSSGGLALLQTTGGLDTTLNVGVGFNNTVTALALQPDGRVIVGGNFGTYKGVTSKYLARINTDGSLDTTFNPGTNLNAAVQAVALQPNGQIVVGGDFTSIGGILGRDHIARFNSDGSLDTNFDAFSGANATVEAVAIQPDGYILLGGDFSAVNGQAFNSIARLDSNGNVDPNFFCGIGVDGPVYSLLVNTNPIYSTADESLMQAGFTIYVGGAFTEYNGTHRLGFARLNSDGTVDTTFLDTAYNQFAGLTRVYYDDPLGVVNAFAVVPGTVNAPTGEVLIGGSFEEVGGGEYDSAIRPTSDANSVTSPEDFRIRSSVRNHSNFARLIGGGTPGPGNIGLAYPTYSISESAGTMPVSLIRANGFLGIATANFSVVPGLAQNGIDYDYAGISPLYQEVWNFRQQHSDALYGHSSVPQDNYNTVYGGNIDAAPTLSILGGETSKANLNAQMQMANPYGADKFYLGGENIPLGVGLGQSAAPFTLINDSHASGTFGFSSSNYVAATKGNAIIGLVRSNGTYGAVSLNYATVTNGSTAVLNNDYQAASGTVTFGDGTTTNYFNVTVLNTNYISTTEKYVNMVLSGLEPPADGVAYFGQTNAALRIINPTFNGYLTLSMTNYPASLSAGVAAVTVNRIVGSKSTLGVQLSTINGSAFSNVDYSMTVTNLTWTNGDVSSRTVLVPLLPTTDFGTNRVFYVNLANATVNGSSSSKILLTTNASVTITNDLNTGTFQFSISDYTVDETGGFATVTVNRSGSQTGLQLPASVHYYTLNGPTPSGAVTPANYAVASNVLNFASGQISQSFPVTIVNDGVTDAPPNLFYFQVNLASASTGSILGAITNCRVHIVDAQSYSRPPGGGDTTFNPGTGMNAPVYALAIQTNGLLLAGGAFTTVNNRPINYVARLNTDGSLDSSGFLNGLAGLNGPVYSVVSQTDDSVVVGGMFTDADGVYRNHIARLLTDGSLDTSFNPGAGADNTVYCLAETFIGGARYIYAGGAFTFMGRTTTPCLARLTDGGTVDTSFNTGLGPNGTVYAVAVYPTNSPDAGKVLIGGAFSAVNNFQVPYVARLNGDGSVDTNFDAGLGLDGIVRSIVIQNDGGIVIGGDFLNAYDSTHGTNAVPAAHLARIYESISGSSYLDTTNFAAGFSGGPNGIVSALALQADNRILVAGTFTSANGVTRNNITRLNTDGSVDPTINFGEGANAPVYAALVQPADQMIVLGGAFTQYDAQPANYIVRIYGGSDTGAGQFEFTSENYSVPETGGYVPVSIQRVGGTSGTNSVDFIIANNTAFAGTNYVNVSQQVVFPAGEFIETVNVPVMDDGVITPNLTATLILTNASAPAGLGDINPAYLTILNEDSGVTFTGSSFSVLKNTPTGYYDVNVIRIGSTSSSNSVQFLTTSLGTAVPGLDFVPTNVTVTFDVGQTNQVVPIQILDNPAITGPRTVIFTLSNAWNTVIYNPSNVTLTIVDTVTAPGQLSFASPNYSITEGGGVGYTDVYLNVVRTNGSAGVVTANFTTMDGTAQAGIKYVYTNGTVTLGDGATSTNFLVQVINTATAEGPETFSVVLSNPTDGATLTSPSTAVVTILNTNTGIAFGSSTYAFTEPAGPVNGTVLLNVMRYNNTNGTSTVYYSTTNGTAVADTNFLAVTNGLLTFNPGDSMETIAISTIHDPLVTGDLNFTVGLANPTGALLTAPSYATVTDHDADAGISLVTNATSVYRNAGFVLIPVTCSNPNVEPVSVTYTTGGGSAVPGLDYTTTAGTLIFSNGATLNAIPVPILLNNSVLTNRTFNFALSGTTPPGVLLQPTTETVTIIGTNTPAGLSFSTPVIISGLWGTTNVDNTLGAAEIGDPSIAGYPANAPVWFEWTAPVGANGEVTMDTIGSVTTNGMKMDTVLAVFSGASLGNLNQVAANDDLYPNFPVTQINEMAQNVFNTNVTGNIITFVFGGVTYTFTNLISSEYGGREYAFSQPYSGPSGLRFNAKAGNTYFIAADSKSIGSYVISNDTIVGMTNGRGPIQLSWAYHPAGVFRFATEEVDQTGITGTNGNPMLLYQCAESEGGGVSGLGGLGGLGGIGSDHRISGTVTIPDFDTTFHAYYYYDVDGLLVTVTRVAGSSGRVMVNYATVDGNTNIINNGDLPAQANGTNVVLVQTPQGSYYQTNYVHDYVPVSGTLVFNDFEMSKTIRIPIIDDDGIPRQNRDFMVVLSNPQRDPSESGDVSAPRVDPIFGQVLCRILDCDIDPKGPSTLNNVTTTILPGGITNVVTNTVIADQAGNLLEPTNGVFNFSKANYRIPRDVQPFWNNAPVTVYVNRAGTNRASVTIHYRFDNDFLDDTSLEDDNNEFPLQPGSDYATPTPPGAGAIKGTNSDFAGLPESGTLAFPGGTGANAFQSQPIHFNVQNNHIPGFNKDIHISLYEENKDNVPQQDGMVAECTVTILFDDTVPPAGSVDELYNPDLATDMAFLTNSLGLSSTVLNPGTDQAGEVYAVQWLQNGQAIIGGSFASYTGCTNNVNGIARLNVDGTIDQSFNLVAGQTGSGVNVNPGGEYVRSVAITPDNKIVIGGDFTSYDSVGRNNIARLNRDGTLDTGFEANSSGANGTVWSVLVQADGKVLIGGEFTTYNGTAANHVARLNTDGTLDTTFNASNLISGPVYAMNLSPQIPLNYTNADYSFTTNENDRVIPLGLQTSGTLNVFLDPSIYTNDFKIYYGTANVAAGTGVLLSDNLLTNTLSFQQNFGPVNGLTNNFITVVVNQGGAPGNASNPDYWTYSITMPGNTNLVVGGNFSVNGQSFANIARLNTDGSLDTTFNPGTGPDGTVWSVGWEFGDQMVIGGSFKNISGAPYSGLARLNHNGSIDGSFFNGTGVDQPVNSITLQPVPPLIYVGGSFSEINGTHRLGYGRLNPDGTVDTTFLDTAYNQFAGLSRLLYIDPPGAVYDSTLEGLLYSSAWWPQTNNNLLIVGSFQEVGGGQADALVRTILEEERGLQPSMTNLDLLVSMEGSALEPKTRDGVRNRSNVAQLIGGASVGPGNIGMASSSYAVDKTQLAEPVPLVRANGSLGYASANFEVVPGLAKSGSDYSYSGVPPLYPIGWEYDGPTRMHSDGQFGADGEMQDVYGELFKYGVNGPASVNIGILNDTAVSGNLTAQFQMANPSQADEFYLGGQDIPLGVALGISQTPLTVLDNTQPAGTFGFASPNYVATNSLVPVLISRTNGSFGTVTLLYKTVTNGSTAVPNVDYIPTNAAVPLAFPQNQLNNSFSVIVLNNSSTTPQEKVVNMQLFGLQGPSTAQFGLTNAVLRIINPNFAGYLTFSTNAYYGNLSSGRINLTVNRTVGSKGTLTLQYGTVNGTARNTVDYVGVTNTLTWTNGDVASRMVSIPLINNNLVGPNKLFAANLFNATLNGVPTPSLLGSISNAVCVIINDNSYGTFQFSSPSYQYNENGGYATINVIRSGAALGTASVGYSTMDGSAFAGTNYVATNNTLIFQAGQMLNTFKVRLLDDGKTNPPPASFYFNVGLSSPSSGAALGQPTNSAVHIVDAESYNEQPGAIDPSFDPTAGLNGSVLSLALQSGGQILAGGTFTVVNGSAINRIARFNTDGTLDSSFMYQLAGADGPVNTVLSQTDDHIVIGGGFATVDGYTRQRITRLMTDGSLDSTFNSGAGADNEIYALAETFIGGARYIYVGGAFDLFNSVPSPGIVRLNNGGLQDPTFNVGSGVVGTVYALAVYSTNSIYDTGDVLVGGSFTNYNGMVVGNLMRLNSNGAVDTNFSQNVSINGAVRAIAIQLDGNVVIGGDFTSVDGVTANHIARLNSDGTLDTAFNTAAASGVNGTVDTLALQADNCIVVGGQFAGANGVTRSDITRLLPTGAPDPTINFGTGANGAVDAAVIQPADGKIVIGGGFTQYDGAEHDHIARIFGGSETGSGTFQFTAANYQIDENAGFATITIERLGGTSGTNADGSGDVFVAFTTTTNGTAVAGTNYVYTTNYVDFPAGEVQKTVFVPVIDDDVITPNLTMEMELSNPTPGSTLGDVANAWLTILNDDSDVVFASTSYTVPKNAPTGLANISLVRVGTVSGSCTVNFATSTNGDAVAGTDYYPTNVLVTFTPGDTNEIVQVPIINNGLPEGPRTVGLMLTNALNTLLAAPSNAVLTIQDTSTNPGDFFFTATNFNANASDGFAYLTVGRTNGTHGPVTVLYTILTNDIRTTAVAGRDYQNFGSSVGFNDGDTINPIIIQLLNNPLPRGPVNLVVGISLSSQTIAGGAGLIVPTNTVLTIGNTNAVFAFTQGTNTVAENAGSVSIVVERFNNTNIVSTVNYATANGTALAGVNYSNTFGTLTFGVDEAFKSVTIPLINQSNTMDLFFDLSLSSPVNAQLVAPSNTVIDLQGSAAGVSFTTNAATVFKNSGSLLVTVVCSNPRVEPVASSNQVPLEVNFTTVDGTAKAGINYNPTNGIIVFTNGIGTNSFNVPIFNNPPYGNQTFSIILTNVTTPGYITPYGTQDVIIAESAPGLSFSQSDYSVPKNAGLATITVYRSGFTDDVVAVNYQITNGTAIGGQNFYPTNGTLTFTNGVTTQSFNVGLIANNLIQPNLFALLELSNPTNITGGLPAELLNPSVATLTILETGGSYVVPAGSQLLTNSTFYDLKADVIGSNDTVLVSFAFRDAAGQNVTNLVAYLLATNGVVAPSPASQSYGGLTVYGHSMSKSFGFTAQGTNGYTISPTFMLYDGGYFIGPATFTYTLGTWTTTFGNTNMIVINPNTSGVPLGAQATPYPSIITVTNLGSSVVKATVTLTNLSIQSLGDVDALVVSPTTNTLIMGHAGGSGTIVKHITLTFDDTVTNSMPQNGAPVTSTNKSTQFYPLPNFP
jgi:uncharacterized delta-60 repeat protein